MSSNIIQNKEHGHWLQAGLRVLTSQMMSHVRFTKSFTSPKIWEIHGNILRVTFLILHGVQQHFLILSRQERMLSPEYSSLMTQISRDTRKQGKDGSKVFISTTLTTSLRHKRMHLMLVIVL